MQKTFTYSVRVSENSVILQDGVFDVMFPRAAELVITSKPFNSYDTCRTKLLSLLSTLITLVPSADRKNYVIVTHFNPKIDPATDITGEEWDAKSISKTYVANAEALTRAELLYAAHGTINISEGLSSLSKTDLLEITG